MNASLVVVLLHKEVRDALRHRWLWLVTLLLALLVLALGGLSLTQASGPLGYGRTVAGLINLTLLLVPLLGFALGAQALAGERERRTLPALLAQPVSRSELLIGKFLGLGLAVVVVLGLGFGGAGLALAALQFDPWLYAGLVGLALLLGLVSLSLGLLVSVLAERVIMALGVALVIWFGLVLVADLGLMGTALVMRVRADVLFALAALNPLQVFKLAAVLLIQPSLDVLGPAGQYAALTFGAWLGPGLVGLLLLWMIGPLVAAALLFRRRGES